MPLNRELIYIDNKDEADRIVRYAYKGELIGVTELPYFGRKP